MYTDNQKAIFKFYEQIVNKQFAMNCYLDVLRYKIDKGVLDGNVVISERFSLTLSDYVDNMQNVAKHISELTTKFRESEVWLKVTDK